MRTKRVKHIADILPGIAVGLQYILDSEEKKKVQEDAKSVIVELHNPSIAVAVSGK